MTDSLDNSSRKARTETARANITLRVPESLRIRLEQAAQQSARSLNSEIVERLTHALEREGLEAALRRVLREERSMTSNLSP